MKNIHGKEAAAYLENNPDIQKLMEFNNETRILNAKFLAIPRDVYGPLPEYNLITQHMDLSPHDFPYDLKRDDKDKIKESLRLIIQENYAHDIKMLSDKETEEYLQAFFHFLGEPYREFNLNRQEWTVPNYNVYVTFGEHGFDSLTDATFDRGLFVSGMKNIGDDTWVHYLLGISGSAED